jgi:hypothetical protein
MMRPAKMEAKPIHTKAFLPKIRHVLVGNASLDEAISERVDLQ